MLFTRIMHIPLIHNNQQIKRNSSQQIFSHKRLLSAAEANDNSLWRAALSTFLHIRFKASLTVEAVLVLPFFLFVCLAFIFFGEVFLIHEEIQGSMLQAARDISEDVSVLQTAADMGIAEVKLSEGVLGIARAKTLVLNYTGELLNASSCLTGGASGLQFWYSEIDQEYVDLIVSYRVSLPYSFGFDSSFPIVQRCRMRAWTGSTGKQSDEEEMVYITKNGEVYHRTPDCSHIKLQVRSVGLIELEQVRNNAGGIYKSCEKCARDGAAGGCAYITADGDKYHNSLSCSGLKRSVSVYPKTQVQDKRACSRCYGT